MNAHKRNEMNTWLAWKAAQARQEEKSLSADDRRDEAVFARIRGNVYEIFRSVLTAAEKTCGDDEQIGRFFTEKLDSIPRSWQDALTMANAHNEGDKAHIEALKLAAAEEIRAKLREAAA